MKLTKQNLINFIKKEDLTAITELETVSDLIDSIEDKFNLIWGVGIRSTRDGSDFWLECDYYSKKIQKTIVFDNDFPSEFENINEFTETILQYNKNIINFETNLIIK